MPRFDVLLVADDGTHTIVNAGRPRALVDFSQEFGHQEPRDVREVAWLVHSALRIDQPLDEWLDGLFLLTADDEDIDAAVAEGKATRPTPGPAKSKAKPPA